MQIVIDIDEEVNIKICEIYATGDDIPIDIQAKILKSIVDGTPLPDNHGRLIDADALTLMDVHLIDGKFLCDAPTIIEASEVSE